MLQPLRSFTHWDKIILVVGYWSPAGAASIFGVSLFGRWIVIHSLADFDFYDHRPAFKMNQFPLWYLMSVQLSTLGPTLGCYFSSIAGDTVKVIAHSEVHQMEESSPIIEANPHFQNSQKKLQDMHLKNPIFFGWMLEFCHHILFKPL